MDKKNTLLLTVIAVLTLLVAVVGATFAFFTAQTGEGASTTMTVTTSTSDSVTYSPFDPLLLIVNQQNFASGLGSQRAKTSGTISLQSSNMDRDTQPEYCYTSTLNVSTNNFTYKPEGTNQPELVLTIKKNGKEYTQQISDLDSKTINDGTGMKVCDQVGGVTSSPCAESETIKGYDLTEFGKVSVPPEPEEPTPLRIPAHTEDALKSDDKPLIHHLKADSKDETKTDTWEASITFVNYDFDQNYNAGKSFIATWDFVPVECSSGDPLNVKP